MSAANSFRCCCCSDDYPEEEASLDQQIGPVCPTCMLNLRWSQAKLKEFGFRGPINVSDINPYNSGRFQL